MQQDGLQTCSWHLRVSVHLWVPREVLEKASRWGSPKTKAISATLFLPNGGHRGRAASASLFPLAHVCARWVGNDLKTDGCGQDMIAVGLKDYDNFRSCLFVRSPKERREDNVLCIVRSGLLADGGGCGPW